MMGLPLLVSIRSESELPRLPTMRRIVASSAAVLVYVVPVATESGLRVEVLKAITSLGAKGRVMVPLGPA